jgi:methyltransferase (TIGR00027 family)
MLASVREGTASHTARSVAAHRLEYARAEAPYGNPEADEALTRDVAAGVAPKHNRMHEYLRARTAFFDHVVVNAIDRGITQVVIGGAGYDGRAFRYARPGVRWFEVDHPATQADKRERVARLALDTTHLEFIPADFAIDPITEPLLAAGLDPALVTLILLEGVAVYLDLPVIERALAAFRRATPAESTLAISMSIHTTTSDARRRFQERVASIGEPARSVLTDEQASDLLAAAGWELSQGPGRLRSAGLLLARATTASAHPERARPTQAPSPVTPGAWPALAIKDNSKEHSTAGPISGASGQPEASSSGKDGNRSPSLPISFCYFFRLSISSGHFLVRFVGNMTQKLIGSRSGRRKLIESQSDNSNKRLAAVWLAAPSASSGCHRGVASGCPPLRGFASGSPWQPDQCGRPASKASPCPRYRPKGVGVTRPGVQH